MYCERTYVQSNLSTGELSLADLIAAAPAADVDSFAITDRNRIHPAVHSPMQEIDGVGVVRGVEIPVTTPDNEQFAILLYGVTPTDEFIQALSRYRNAEQRPTVTEITRVLPPEILAIGIHAPEGTPVDTAQSVLEQSLPELDERTRVCPDEIVHSEPPATSF